MGDSMSGVILKGDTSGDVTLSVPAVAGSNIVTVPANTGTMALTSQLGGFRNRIINGAMMIDQRNAGASITPTADSTYSLDRWICRLGTASKFSVQQNAGSVTPPAGFINYLGVTSTSAYSSGSGDYFALAQYIEGLNLADLGWGTANAKTVTLSFWVYSSLTGTFGGVLKNSGYNRSYPFSYTISSANTWTQISVTVAGDTTGTWLTTNGIGCIVGFNLGCGSTYLGAGGAWAAANYWGASASTAVTGTNGATFYITGVQLEVGASASSFEVRDYGRELILCQRYCQVIGCGSVGRWNSTSGFEHGIVYKTTMRTTPSVAAFTTTPAVYNIGVASTTASGFSPSINSGSATGAMLVGSINAWGGTSGGSFFALASDALLFTAEL